MKAKESPRPHELIIGLEVHVQLKTKTKLFCRCSTEFGAPPNTQVCPVCLGLPGALPVLNQRAIDLAIQTGLALHCDIPSLTKWDRKQYFYPDLPKGYQISQFDLPICADGFLDITDGEPEGDGATNRIRLVRAHLEEDAGKSMHDEASGTRETRIDLNRCGTPLLEIVSQPDMRSAAQARAFLSELKLLLRHLDVSDCEMQEGSLRVDANVNLHIDVDGLRVATPIVEIKNMNSFRAVERAIQYEARRQYVTWEDTGETIETRSKQTRGWDDASESTFAQREKEESADYRYFPDPDLLPLRLQQDRIENLRASLGELPSITRERLQTQYDLKFYDADVIVNQGPVMIAYFEQTASVSGAARRTSSWIQQDVMRALNERDLQIDQFPISANQLGELLRRIEVGDFDNSRGKDLFQYMLDHQCEVDAAVDAMGIKVVDADEIETLCRDLIAANPQIVQQIRDGKTQAVGSLIGQAKKRNPNANPQAVRETLIKMIGDSDAGS
jgi:aspartyl-tRNA(Asn)/glutamyl-tRNA(Gln) amidotransferase subunit B